MKKPKPDSHRTLTPKQIAAQHVGSRRVAPGIWLDANGDVHFSVPELLAFVDLEDTPENREAVVEMAIETFRAQNPTASIIRQDPES